MEQTAGCRNYAECVDMGYQLRTLCQSHHTRLVQCNIVDVVGELVVDNAVENRKRIAHQCLFRYYGCCLCCP